MMKRANWIWALALICVLSACAGNAAKDVLEPDESQVMLRSIQTRAFETTDKTRLMRAVIATMQDLDFTIDKADDELGAVTGTKLHGYSMIKMTVTVRPKDAARMLVRANAQFGLKAIDKPEPYQDFFAALEKSVFLQAQQVD